MVYGVKDMALAAIVLPYVMLFPFSSDVQPLAGVLCFFWLVFVNKDRLYFSSFDQWFVFFALLYTININRFGVSFDGEVVRKHLNMLYILPIFFFGKMIKVVNYKVILFVLIGISFFGVFQLVAPSAYGLVAKHLIAIKADSFGGRGISSLAPEPTDLGFSMFFLYVLVLLLESKKMIRINKSNLLKRFSFVVALLSVSGSAYFAYFFSYLMRFKLTYFRVFVAVLIFFVMYSFFSWAYYNPGLVVRPVYMLGAMFNNPEYLIGSTSLSFRFVHFMVGFLSIFYSDYFFIGSGIGSVSDVAYDVLTKSDLLSFLPLTDAYKSRVYNSLGGNQMLSSAGQLMLEMGVAGVFFLGYIFYAVYRYTRVLPSYVAGLVILSFALYFFQSFPISYPFPWFVLGLLMNKNLYTPI